MSWEDELGYCQSKAHRRDVIEKEGKISEFPKVKEQVNPLKETINDDIEQLRISNNQQDAKIGQKLLVPTSFLWL